MIPDIDNINIERMYLRKDFGLRDSWELERIANGGLFQYYTCMKTNQRYVLIDPSESWTTLARLRFGR
jgi:hypothetical protein